MDFADIILFHRKQAGLSRNELASLAGVGKTLLYDIEHGKTSIRLDTLLKVLRALNIRLEWNSPLKLAMEANESAADETARQGPGQGPP